MELFAPLFAPLEAMENFAQARANESRTAQISDVTGSQKWYLAAAILAKQTPKLPALIVTYSEFAAKGICEDMRLFADNCRQYPSRDPLSYMAEAKGIELTKKRMEILNSLESAPVIVLSAEALLDRLSAPQAFEESTITIVEGMNFPAEELLPGLQKLGFSRVYQVEAPGQFAMRGGILDIYTAVSDLNSRVTAVRIDFFDDEVDSIRVLDPFSQRSGERVTGFRVRPITENLEDAGTYTLLDYLPEGSALFLDEPGFIQSHLAALEAQFAAYPLTKEQFWEKLAPRGNKFLFTAMNTNTVLAPERVFSFRSKSLPPLRRKPDELSEDLAEYLNQNYAVVLLSGTRASGRQLAESLSELLIPARFAENDAQIENGIVSVMRGSLSGGFEFPEAKLAVLTDKEFFAGQKSKQKRKRARIKDGAKIEHFTDLKIGDYIVHENHGVGVFRGIEQIVSDGISRDYLKLSYADGGNLYVHTAQMDLVQKYIGGQANLRLNKLGGADWAKAKARVRGALKIMAEDLVKLYAKRQASQGFVYSPDTTWQTEFEDSFMYEETDDQLHAIEEVKRDMQSKKVMDRLICGDVGYGKTEVAIRAAFKAVQDGKQVAYLVPTTILAQQHYSTFAARMKDYPITIERLSRFQTKKEQQETLKRLESGEADIVIGTHRILSKDVKFRALGLAIIDEEQRFGVTHKEKLKVLTENVDVMTLTATPIPRTLHLSLTGLRDMSILNEPPGDRKPVQTYVMEYSPDFVREAVLRELARGGQVYYLHNRIRNIAEEAAKVAALVPEARVGYAHGQMTEHELELRMLNFIDGDLDVLVCTTIVETGLDIPNVNTIIVQNADFMGLGQLYQLRGRVGRSDRLAYAYLMYRKDKILDEVAAKRLQAIKDFTEFGAGFKVAMRDLEIRGAGNLLGAEQHGHMDAIGYDMYCKLLEEAVSELKGRPVEPTFETTIDLGVNAYIPDYYIEDEAQKLEMYKKISMIKSSGGLIDAEEELIDRFGRPPQPVQTLLEAALFKSRANKLGITGIAQKDDKLIITFKGDAKTDPNNLTALVTSAKGKILFTMSANPYLTCEVGDDVLAVMGGVLDGLEK